MTRIVRRRALAALGTALGLVMPLHRVEAQSPVTSPAIGQAGMVSTGHPLATEAGLSILTSGGNAFDAAVAIAAALNVVEPMMSGIGGYGTILVYDAKTRRARFLNSSGRIPAAVNSDAYRAPTPGYLENRRGAKAVSTPGNLHAWEAMSREYGTQPWRTLFAHAIRLADSGFVVGERNAGFISGAYSSFPTHAKAIYGSGTAPLGAGERLVQRDLARSLRLIADSGAAVFYGGSLGRTIDRAMRQADGFLALADLTNDKAEWWDPIAIQYRGLQVLTASPPANSFDALARLGIMERFDAKTLGHNSGEYLHRFAEATKIGFWMRLRFAGDPEIAPPPIARLFSKQYLDSLAASIDPNRARPFVPPGVTVNTGDNTTHFVVADRWGNVVSATQTLGNAFGARIMVEGTGIWLNNSLAYSTFEPKGNPMDAFGGRRKLSGDVPTIVMRDGRPWIAIGTPGGHTIGQTVPQMVMNVIDFNMDIQRAIAAPRVSFFEPDSLIVEPGVPEAVRAQLVAKGHKIRVPARAGLGDAHGLTIEYDTAGRPIRFTGGTDPRGDGLAKGATAAAPSRGSTENDVYQAVFRNALTRIGGTPEILVIDDSTEDPARADGGLAGWATWRQQLRQLPGARQQDVDRTVPALVDDVIKDFRSRNAKRELLRGRVSFVSPTNAGVPYPFAGEVRLDSVLTGSSSSFYGTRPYARVVVSFSEIGFSADGTLALVYLGMRCGGRCGIGELVLMRRAGSGWEQRALVPLWMS